MKNLILSLALVPACLFLANSNHAFAQGTAFTYQGQLSSGTNLANGNYDLHFYLRDAVANGNPVGATNTLAPVAVSNGIFTVTLDFGVGIFTGNPRWLEVGVRTNGSAGAYTALSPRQAITSTPYAIQAANSGNLGGQPATSFAPNSGSASYVAKSGDTMTGSLNIPSTSILNFGGTTRQMLDLFGGGYGIGVQNYTLYSRTANGFAWYLGGVHNDNQTNAGGGSTLMTLDPYGDLDVTGAVMGHVGVYGTSSGGSFSSGVSGTDNSGYNNSTGVSGTSSAGDGVYGVGANKGVHGLTSSAGPTHAGVFGENSAVGGTGVVGNALNTGSAGVAGVADASGSTGVYGRGSLWAGNFDGNVNVNGTLTTKILTIAGADLAEPFDIAESALPRGTVVVIDGKRLGGLRRSTKAYDTGVAGIVSGANGINSGIILSQPGVNEGGQNVALSGRVYVLADATGDPILPGDLLTTSSVPGHAMKAGNHAKAVGAVIGKAMSPLPQGRGMVLVLVTLQ
jgi:hypothetical protein